MTVTLWKTPTYSHIGETQIKFGSFTVIELCFKSWQQGIM